MLNKYFVYLQDYEFTEEPLENSRWVLLTSTTVPEKIHAPPVPPISIPPQNAFANHTLAQINTFVRSHEAELAAVDLSSSVWLVVDQIGLDNLTCIVVEQETGENEETEDFEMKDTFRAAWVPCSEVWSIFANLTISNMEFEDYMVSVEAGEDGFWTYDTETFKKEDIIERRETALKVLKKLGHL